MLAWNILKHKLKVKKKIHELYSANLTIIDTIQVMVAPMS